MRGKWLWGRGALAALGFAVAAAGLGPGYAQAAHGWSVPESKVIIRADSAAMNAVGGGRVVALNGAVQAGIPVLVVRVVRGQHVYRVSVNPQTDQTMSVVKIR
ncbi:MAG: hypothetical protein OWR62_02115 [Sulfobacillus thermotolerans]|uniref:Peptidase M23 n=1 Tax=Sulfobacillus thermotolerans TaxID=338644 RepID=A0ABN5GX55_9FIRM|nr:hypothetical protein BXT84_02270 [Sulfobacillus thermotolerans]MCY0907168.1 hypothetical protein [Sulfobacillus thermotolerans]